MSIAEELLAKLNACQTASEAGDVDLESYNECWVHISSVLGLMGSVFKFVKSDVDDKVAILKRIHGAKGFKSVGSMMVQEKENGDINYEKLDEKNPSGSRTLLRLHRALKMVALLLHKIAINEHNGKMSSIAYDSYHQCPMPAHHPWAVRQAINVAVYTLTDTVSFCRQIAPGLEGEALNAKLEEAAAMMLDLFDRTEAWFLKEKLEKLP